MIAKSTSLLFALILTFILVGCTAVSGLDFPRDRIGEVAVGMTSDEVKNILGEPYLVERYSQGARLIWSYSTSKIDHTFVVVIEEDEVQSLSEYKDYQTK